MFEKVAHPSGVSGPQTPSSSLVFNVFNMQYVPLPCLDYILLSCSHVHTIKLLLFGLSNGSSPLYQFEKGFRQVLAC